MSNCSEHSEGYSQLLEADIPQWNGPQKLFGLFGLPSLTQDEYFSEHYVPCILLISQIMHLYIVQSFQERKK
jgi:hypothetical protein